LGESISGLNLLDADVGASKRIPLRRQMLHIASPRSVVGDCCFGLTKRSRQGAQSPRWWFSWHENALTGNLVAVAYLS
jgi:hypothetical protein